MMNLKNSAALAAVAAAARVPHGIERKEASPAEMVVQIKGLIDEKGAALAAHAAKITALEGKAGDYLDRASLDAVNVKLAELDKSIATAEQAHRLATKAAELAEEATLASQRGNGAGARESADSIAHRKGFEAFIRKGNDSGLAELQAKSLNVTTAAEGGHAVPEAIDAAISALILEVSPMRQLAEVVTAGQGYQKLVDLRGTAAGWLGETAARPETTAPQLAKLAPAHGDLQAHLFATSWMLDNAIFDVEGWIRDSVGKAFAVAEGLAFTSGSGTDQPKGFLTYTNAATADGVRAFGSLQYVATGVSADWAASDPESVLYSALFAMKGGHRQAATWQLASTTAASLRGLKDADGRSLWVDSLAMGLPNVLCGRPVAFNEEMPAIAANSLSIAVGDWKAAYQCVDMGPRRMIRDPYSNKPYITFYTVADIGGQVVDSEAIKLVKFGIS